MPFRHLHLEPIEWGSQKRVFIFSSPIKLFWRRMPCLAGSLNGNQTAAIGTGWIGTHSVGSHFCLFYETKDDLLDVAIPLDHLCRQTWPAWWIIGYWAGYIAGRAGAASQAVQRGWSRDTPKLKTCQLIKGRIEMLSIQGQASISGLVIPGK